MENNEPTLNETEKKQEEGKQTQETEVKPVEEKTEEVKPETTKESTPQANGKKKKRSLKQLGQEFFETAKEVGTYVTKRSFKEIATVIGEILVLVILLCLLKIPFSLIRDVFINMLFSMEIKSTMLMNLLYFIFGLPYYIIAIYLFIKLFTDRYHDINSK